MKKMNRWIQAVFLITLFFIPLAAQAQLGSSPVWTKSIRAGSYNGSEQPAEATTISQKLSELGYNGGVSGQAKYRNSYYRFTASGGAYFTLKSVASGNHLYVGSVITVIHKQDFAGIATNKCGSIRSVRSNIGITTWVLDDSDCTYFLTWENSSNPDYRYLGIEPPPINGACSSYSTTAASRCASGTSGPVTETESAYSWFCNGVYDGYSVKCTETKPAPTATLTADDSSVPYNYRTFLNWSSTNATSCTTNDSWSTGGATSGRGWTDLLMSNTTFEIQCSGNGQVSTKKSVTVSVRPRKDGQCEPSHYSCRVGSSVQPVEGSSSWTWYCLGSDGGINASCSETKPQCTAQTVGNCALPATASGSSAGSCGSGYSGSCSYACSSGTWTQSSNSCTPPPPACAAQTTGNCTLPATASGSSAGSCGSGYSGTCSYACSSGTWTQSANSCTSTACTLPWGGSIASGQSATAYQSSSVTHPATCSSVSQTRTCTNGSLGGSYTNQSCTVAAPTATFTASPSSVAYNGRSTLTWSSTGATSCTAGGPWSTSGNLSGSGLTDPMTTNTTFTFQCTGPGGTSPLRSVTISVAAAPVDGTCAPDHYSCSKGTSASNVSGATSWTWSCQGLSGGSTAPCSQEKPLPTASLSANPSAIYKGHSAKLKWSSTDATSCTAAGGFSTGGATSNNAGVSVSPSDTSSYQITCAGPTGTSAPAMATITVTQPTIIITPSTDRIITGGESGGGITISWTVQGIDPEDYPDGCVITRNGAPWQTIPKNQLGTPGTGSYDDTITTQTSYSISCTDDSGVTSTSASRVVNVQPSFQEF